VCALMCACAASLMCMVARFSIGKKACRRHEPFLKRVLTSSSRARQAFLKFTDEDCVAYARRDMRAALSVPRAVARAAEDLISLCPELARKGNPALSSDTAIAAALLEAGFTGACWNVAINCKGTKGARSPLAGLAAGEKRVRVLRVRTEKTVGSIIRR
jgi:methenyltetrahydrofolate cyclohydrolase